MTLAHSLTSRYIAPVPFNSGTGIGVPNQLADNRCNSGGFFSSVRCCTPFSMVGRSGGVLARAGFQLAGTPTLLRACHPRLASGGRLQPQLEATMPSIALRAVRALFPLSAVPVSTVPTHAEACAVARLLVLQGKRIAIAPADRGYTVSEVRA